MCDKKKNHILMLDWNEIKPLLTFKIELQNLHWNWLGVQKTPVL